MELKHDKTVYIRLFRIWQKTGTNPFKKQREFVPIECPGCGETINTPYCPHCGQKYVVTKRKKNNVTEFFKGSFENIPFLNDDAKRTFVHILLRPGYMIRDYLNGKNSSYMSPMTSLIIFYAFFALVSNIIAPEVGQERESNMDKIIKEIDKNGINIETSDSTKLMATSEMLDSLSGGGSGLIINNKDKTKEAIEATTDAISLYTWFHLDTNPEKADTKFKASIAALEKQFRNGGITLFLGNLIFMTIAIWFVFRKKYGISFSASAAISAYILCQFCFFMLFFLLATWGGKTEIGILIMAILMVWDFIQLFGLDRRKALRKTIHVGLAIGGEYAILCMIAGAIVSLKLLI